MSPTGPYLKNNADAVKRFMMAMATAVHEYKANPDIAIPLTQAFLKVKETADTKAAYDAYVKIYPDDLRPSLPGIQLVLDEIALKVPKAKSMKPEQLVDTSILDALQKEGFFAKLGK